MARPLYNCVLCGQVFLVSNIHAHVGGERCLLALQRTHAGVPVDSVKGPRVLALLQELAELLRPTPCDPTP